MADDTLTLRLDGEVSLASFQEAIESLSELIDALSADITPSTAIAWVVADLAAGSAKASVRGQVQSGDEIDDVTRIVQAYGIVGKALQGNNVIPYSPRVQKSAQRLTNVLDGRITAIHLETSRGPLALAWG